MKQVTVTILPSQEHDEELIRKAVEQKLVQQGESLPDGARLIREKRSIDARHGKPRLVLRYTVRSPGDTDGTQGTLPEWHHAGTEHRVIIVGSGPAGLFAAFALLEHGIQPVIVERGSDVHERKRDIAAISTRGTVGTDSNYCFGEGGAGTFSDGKLYTRSNKRGDIPQVLRMFVRFGADERILTDAHPHIGTDRLPAVVQAMRKEILSLGGEIHFDTQCTDLITEQTADGKAVRGIRTRDTKSGGQSELRADAVLLATGHSAADIYRMVAAVSPEALEAKTFAVGVRAEHPRALIDKIQYHGKADAKLLGAAEYRFTSLQEGRGVYSFCMCPGGFIVPSATAPGQIVVNGMSAAGRNSAWSNAAFVVETRPEDIPAQFVREGEAAALAGLGWRTWLEEETFRHGDGQKAPAQRLEDFLSHTDSKSLPATSYAPGVVPSRLDQWLPERIAKRLEAALTEAGKRMKGFICRDALLVASETRTSTPVRILRDAGTYECTALHSLYPAGEGSGYAGGIVSSAMDGMNVAHSIARALTPPDRQ